MRALEKSVLENAVMAWDMGRLECTHEGKLRCKQENHELQMENEQLAKQNTLLTMRLNYDHKEEEWKQKRNTLWLNLKFVSRH